MNPAIMNQWKNEYPVESDQDPSVPDSFRFSNEAFKSVMTRPPATQEFGSEVG